MAISYAEKTFNKRAQYLYGKSCLCGEACGTCLSFYKDKEIDWSTSKDKIEQFIKEGKVMCANCWLKHKHKI